jgi:acyl-coenzyme A thioesterase PaaI-like protein
MLVTEIIEAVRTGIGDGDSILRMWEQSKKLPGGRLMFSKAIGRMAPYTGTIGARIVQLERGYARVEMDDRKAVRNHLNSVHAIALMNLAEETSGLATMSCLPAGCRGILRGLRIEYLKKARGTITGESQVTIGAVDGPTDMTVQVDLRNADGDLVCRAEADWRLGPRRD